MVGPRRTLVPVTVNSGRGALGVCKHSGKIWIMNDYNLKQNNENTCTFTLVPVTVNKV